MSPSLELVEEAMKAIEQMEGLKEEKKEILPMQIMVRLSGPSFDYSTETIAQMVSYICRVKELNVKMLESANSRTKSPIKSFFSGFVFGCTESKYSSTESDLPNNFKELGAMITPDSTTNKVVIAESKLLDLIQASRPHSVTFHRAFDEISDKTEALAILSRYGVERVLTCGGKDGSVDDHFLTLAKLISDSQALVSDSNFSSSSNDIIQSPERDLKSHKTGKYAFTENTGEMVESGQENRKQGIIVMPGGGVRPHNAKHLMELGAIELHSSKCFFLSSLSSDTE
jgi:copper homeostasis protein CutC